MKRCNVIRRYSTLVAALNTLLFVPAQAALKPQAPTTADYLMKVQFWQRDVALVLWQKPEANPQTLIVGYNPFEAERIKKLIGEPLKYKLDGMESSLSVGIPDFAALRDYAQDFVDGKQVKGAELEKFLLLRNFLKQRLDALEYTNPGITEDATTRNTPLLDDNFKTRARTAGAQPTPAPPPQKNAQSGPAPAPKTQPSQPQELPLSLWQAKLIELSPRFPTAKNLPKETQSAIYNLFHGGDEKLAGTIYDIVLLSKTEPLKAIAELDYNGKPLDETILEQAYKIAEKAKPISPQQAKTQDESERQLQLAIELYGQSQRDSTSYPPLSYDKILQKIASEIPKKRQEHFTEMLKNADKPKEEAQK